MLIQAQEETDLIVRVLQNHGVTRAAAQTQARVLVEGDLRGQHSHGLQRLPMLIARITNGLIAPVAQPRCTWLSESFLEVDGQRGLGPVVAFDVIALLVERADEVGLAIGAVRNSNHLGMLSCYVEQIAAAGRVGIALTTSEALVHPWGGKRAMVGTNPIGVGVPNGDDPFVLDMSTGAVSRGKILAFARNGQIIPPGWAVDSDGNSTTDSKRAVDGAISPFGGSKGYALGIALELIVAILTDSGLGEQVRGTLDSEAVCNKGDLFIVFSPARLGLSGAVDRVAGYLKEVRASPLANGAEQIDIPGDRSRRLRRKRIESGIPIDEAVWQAAQELRSGVDHDERIGTT